MSRNRKRLFYLATLLSACALKAWHVARAAWSSLHTDADGRTSMGHSAAMDKLCTLAREHNIVVIEDASHAHGSIYRGRKVGTLGDIGVLVRVFAGAGQRLEDNSAAELHAHRVGAVK